MPAAGTGKPGKAGPEGKGGSFGAPSERTDAGKEALQPALLTGPREFALAGIGDLGVCHACRCNAVIGGDVGRANQTGNLDIFIAARSEEHTSELQSLMRISYAVFCLNKKITNRYYVKVY